LKYSSSFYANIFSENFIFLDKTKMSGWAFIGTANIDNTMQLSDAIKTHKFKL